ncbi:MAG: HEAT repeat domain-containing protein, partial [Methanobrevibacter sp.]|jgi:HEAT repeat protein|nr:HEAT repeat domain-containing protein [Methanobrevibacter sp.]
MSETEDKVILKKLREITKDKNHWSETIDYVGEKLDEEYSVEVRAKALWLLGEMGLNYPVQVKQYVEDIADYMDDNHMKLRERSLNALGRIGRADKDMILPYFDELMTMGNDESDDVRLAFIWACENIATNAPELFCESLNIFYELLFDSGERVRMEAPEMFRVMGKRKPEQVKPYLEKLEWISENDEHRVVRIHSAGAVRVTKKALEKSNKNS